MQGGLRNNSFNPSSVSLDDKVIMSGSAQKMRQHGSEACAGSTGNEPCVGQIKINKSNQMLLTDTMLHCPTNHATKITPPLYLLLQHHQGSCQWRLVNSLNFGCGQILTHNLCDLSVHGSLVRISGEGHSGNLLNRHSFLFFRRLKAQCHSYNNQVEKPWR
jgi:hypothetical protein